MLYFIKLHLHKDNKSFFINVQHIVGFGADPGGGTGILMNYHGKIFYYRETPEQIEQMIGRLVDHERAPDTV